MYVCRRFCSNVRPHDARTRAYVSKKCRPQATTIAIPATSSRQCRVASALISCVRELPSGQCRRPNPVLTPLILIVALKCGPAAARPVRQMLLVGGGSCSASKILRDCLSAKRQQDRERAHHAPKRVFAELDCQRSRNRFCSTCNSRGTNCETLQACPEVSTDRVPPTVEVSSVKATPVSAPP